MTETVTTDAPDWSLLTREILCPLCDYNLRGLHEPFCPECGYRFEWRALLDENHRRHPYLFEHHPQHNVRSFLQTLYGGLRPKRFWSQLKPQQPSAPQRLGVYATIIFVTLLAAMVASVLTLAPDAAAPYYRMFGFVDLNPFTGRSLFAGALLVVWTWFSFMINRGFYVMGFPLLLAACPWVTLLALLVFTESMGRAKVRTIHVLRCVTYSSDILVIYAIALIVIAVTTQTFIGALISSEFLAWMLLLLAITTWATATRRLTRAYALYLQFDRPRRTILATQVIVALALLAIVKVSQLW